MAWNSGRLSQLRSGFKQVYGFECTDNDLLVRYVEQIIFYSEPFPFENEDLTNYRLSNVTDSSDIETINKYLNKIPEDIVLNKPSRYARLFELAKMYNIIDVDGSTTESTTTKITNPNSNSEVDENGITDIEDEMETFDKTNLGDTVPNVNIDDTDIINNNKNTYKEKEDSSMDQTNVKGVNAIEDLKREAMGDGVGTSVATNVSEISKNDRIAAQKVVEQSQSDRRKYSEEAKITEVLVTRISRDERAIDGRKAMGKVSKPDKAFMKFVEVTGAEESADGKEVVFSKLHPQSKADAMEMYKILKEAKTNPDLPVEPYFGKEDASVPVAIKGIKILTPEGKELTLAQKDIASFLLQKTFAFLNVESTSKAQFQIDSAVARKGSTNKPKHSYVVRIANKSEMLADNSVLTDVKELTTNTSETKTGFKSKLSVVCKSDKVDAKGNNKKVTWRIPLEVEQYEVVIVDGYDNLFSKGIGNAVKPIVINNPEDIMKVMNKIGNMLADEYNRPESALDADTIQALKDEKNALTASEADIVNKQLGMGGEATESEDQFA